MKVLLAGEWVDGFPDYHRGPYEYRVEVLAWHNLERLRGVYFARPTSVRVIWNYVREIGPRGVLRKVVSRARERHRNEKYVACGVGRVEESADERRFPRGSLVAFLAPCHPACLERLSLPAEMLACLAEADVVLPAASGAILHLEAGATAGTGERWWRCVAGWSPYDGDCRMRQRAARVLPRVREQLRRADWAVARRLPADPGSRPAEVREPAAVRSARGKRRAVLFGYGHYAKTIVLPNVRGYLNVECVHEIDPTQIPRGGDAAMRWDTAPGFRPGESYEVALIAGFHHTHAPLAIAALDQGAYAVVEKPIVVNRPQLAELMPAVERSPKLFACFHKRYLPFNSWAFRDLGIARGAPVSYHCVVYEVPLPELHWYRWPNSASRLVSNGCHWLDHFLYLNEFARVRTCDLVMAPDGTLNCSVTLENGAFFTMVLTDRGSERIGVQDYVELRARSTTVRMVNGAVYEAEGRDRLLRRSRINKLYSYAHMYQDIGRRIQAGAPGDTRESIEISAELTLALEEKLAEKLSDTRRSPPVGQLATNASITGEQS